METIAFPDFAKVELRVAKVLECEPVEGSDKLYRLSIRIGSEARTLVAGIAEHYAPDELLGRKIIVVANLEPKVLKGIPSQGMLLAASTPDGGKISLLTVDDEEVPDGAEIH